MDMMRKSELHPLIYAPWLNGERTKKSIRCQISLWRLGQALEIDVLPRKTCNMDCIYCHLGRSNPVSRERKDFYDPQEILEQIRCGLATCRAGALDWITFSGSGDPTLYASLGWLIRQVKNLSSAPVVVITKGALLHQVELRDELSPANAVICGLDAGSEELYDQINRPHPDMSFQRLLEGLVAFRKETTAKLWIEVMLVRGVNDSKPALLKLAEELDRISPDEIHISLPVLNPAEKWVQPPDREGLMQAVSTLGSVAPLWIPGAREASPKRMSAANAFCQAGC
jgi:wyosine [tRNA(Phe)-imidazoG37] synthetase (radical SAM superfamily)